ncbi:HERC2 [Symbiodinium sp. CCMP2592]|nr:HERC2 [Symbiodinium sp. CCMP2592]
MYPHTGLVGLSLEAQTIMAIVHFVAVSDYKDGHIKFNESHHAYSDGLCDAEVKLAAPNTPLYEVKWQAQQALNCHLDVLVRASGCRLREASTLEELGIKDGETLSAATLRRPPPVNRLAHAFALPRRDGSLVVWGNRSLGGDCSDVQEQLKEVEDVIFSHAAAAARLANGGVVTWGDKRYGADSRAVQTELCDVRDIRASYDAFAALRSDGRVVTWCGRDRSACVDHLRGVRLLASARYAFAAVLEEGGKVVAWGDVKQGGDVGAAAEDLVDICQIEATSSAFAARRSDGVVIPWGEATSGGDPGPLQGVLRRGGFCDIQGSGKAFAAIHREDGSVVTWGSCEGGCGQRRVQSIAATSFSFAALLIDGSVEAWGNLRYGGAVDVQKDLQEVVQLAGNGGAFAALRSDGRVVVWGHPDYGGEEDCSNLTDVRELRATYGAFAAICGDGTVVTWGDPVEGGGSSFCWG